MKKLNFLFVMLTVALTLTMTDANAQCTPEKNILAFTNSSGATVPDSDFTISNAGDNDVVAINGTPVKYEQGAIGDVQIYSNNDKRYFVPDGDNGTGTYTNFFLRHNGRLYHSGGNVTAGTLRKFKAYKKSNRIGSGTEADPWRRRVKFYADTNNNGSYDAASDILVTKTVSYANGEIYVRKDYVIDNPTSHEAQIYEQRDEEYPSSPTDAGYGYYATTSSTQLEQGTGNTNNTATVVNGVIAIVNAQASGSDTNLTGSATNTSPIVGFTQGADGSAWQSYESRQYQMPYDSSGSPVQSGANLSNRIGSANSDIGFTVQLPNATASGSTTLTLYEIVGRWQDICASPPCAAPTVAVSGDNNSDNKICPTGETITLTATADSSVTNPQYEFSKDGTVVQAYSTTDTYSITGTAGAGSYTVKVKGDNCIDSAPSTAIVITAATAAECTPVCAAPTLAITAGDNAPANKICPADETIVLTATADSSVTNPQYEFSKDGAVVQAYSATSTYNVTGTAGAGSYTVKVKGDNCSDSDASTAVVITAATAAECVEPVAATLSGNQVNATGGTGNYTYTNVTNVAGKCDSTPAGTTKAPDANVSVSATGAVTTNDTGLAPGTYSYCIEVCDDASPTPSCAIVQGTFEVTCGAGTAAPTLQKN